MLCKAEIIPTAPEKKKIDLSKRDKTKPSFCLRLRITRFHLHVRGQTYTLTYLPPHYLSSPRAALMIRKCGTVSNLSAPPGLLYFCAISHTRCSRRIQAHPNPKSFFTHAASLNSFGREGRGRKKSHCSLIGIMKDLGSG